MAPHVKATLSKVIFVHSIIKTKLLRQPIQMSHIKIFPTFSNKINEKKNCTVLGLDE